MSQKFSRKSKIYLLFIVLVCISILCVVLHNRSHTATFGEIYDINPAEITSIDINSYEHYYPYDHGHFYELLSKLKLRPFSFDPPPRPIDHIVYLRLNRGATTYSMSFSAELDQLFIAESKREPNGNYTTTDAVYAILNPDILTKQDRSHLTTTYLKADNLLQFRLDSATVTKFYTAVESVTKQEFFDTHNIALLCSLLNDLQISDTRDWENQAEHISIHMTLDDQSMIELYFDKTLSTCRIYVSRLVNGEHEYTFISTPHQIDNPELLQNSDFIQQSLPQ